MEYLHVTSRTTGRPTTGSPPQALAGRAVRRHPRTSAPGLMARLRVGDGAITVLVADISIGGFFARTTAHPLPVGAFVELSLFAPGVEEVSIGGVVVDDPAQRQGLAIRFEAMGPAAARGVRRLVEASQDQVEGFDPDRGVQPTLAMATSATAEDDEIAGLRQQIARLRAENKRLQEDVERGAEAERLVGRLQVDVERLRQRLAGAGPDLQAIADLKRDAEQAWTAVARLNDAVDRLR